jgi:hypothetical protein
MHPALGPLQEDASGTEPRRFINASASRTVWPQKAPGSQSAAKLNHRE